MPFSNTIIKFAAALVVTVFLAMTAGEDAQADGFNRNVEIENRSASPIVRLSGGGRNFLGSQQVLPGQSLQINFDDGNGTCVYMLRVDFANGTSESESIDVCTLSRYAFY